jgi:hypothetical protein
MKAIHGGKAKNDKIDSQKIAALLRGGMLPQAYVYPAERRATRDLLRRRTGYPRKAGQFGVGHVLYGAKFNHEFSHPAEDRHGILDQKPPDFQLFRDHAKARIRHVALLLEEVADDRTYETWYERVKARLEPMQTHVLYLVSDRAKALIKLAETGLKCPSIPDLFHLLHERVKGYSLAIWRQLKTARQGLSRVQIAWPPARLRGPARRRSSRPGRRWRPAKPRWRTGNRFATRTGVTSKRCRGRFIPGG